MRLADKFVYYPKRFSSKRLHAQDVMHFMFLIYAMCFYFYFLFFFRSVISAVFLLFCYPGRFPAACIFDLAQLITGHATVAMS